MPMIVLFLAFTMVYYAWPVLLGLIWFRDELIPLFWVELIWLFVNYLIVERMMKYAEITIYEGERSKGNRESGKAQVRGVREKAGGCAPCDDEEGGGW
jgi:hypothetical protein